MLKTVIKKSFNVLKNNLIFIQPPLLLMLIILTAVSYSLNDAKAVIPNIILGISMILLTIAFASGWFYINKAAVLSYDENSTKEEITITSIKNFRKFFEGVGTNFANILLSSIIMVIISIIVFFSIFKVLSSSIGIPNFVYELQKVVNTNSQQELINFLNGISNHDKLTFFVWVLSVNIANVILNYVWTVFNTAITFENKNVFVCLKKAIIFIFKNLFQSFSIIVFTSLIYILLNIISSLAGTSIVAFIIMILLFITYLNYYVLLVFCFYNEKTKINCDNRTECLG